MLTAAASSHALKTAPQRSPSGRFLNSKTPWPWRINRKNKFPGGRNVPSEILLEILSNPAIPYPALLLEIESNPIHPMLTAAASSHALKTAPQRSPSGRFRNSKTPWPWRTERPLNQSQEQVPWGPECPFWNPTRNPLQSCYPLSCSPAGNRIQSNPSNVDCCCQLPCPLETAPQRSLAGGSETAKHHGPEGRNDL